jgi:hypothetical protein
MEQGFTIGNFSNQVGDKEPGGGIGKLVASEFQVRFDSHHSRILRVST